MRAEAAAPTCVLALAALLALGGCGTGSFFGYLM